MNKKKYLSVVVAVCLSGAALALLGFLLTSKAGTSYASPVQAPADTPDLIINVQAGDETVVASEVISFMLLYTNTLPSPLSDVVISSTLSSQQYFTPPTYLSDPIIPTINFTYSGNFDDGYVLEWQLGTLTDSVGGWIIVTTTLPPEAQPPWKESDRWPLLGMSAVITTSTPGVSAGNPQGEEGDSASVMVVGPVLQLSKTDDPDPVRPGRLLTYTLTLENDDREDAITANGIVITDALPANTLFYTASATGFYSATSPSTGLIIWQPPDPLAPGGAMEVSFTVRLTESIECQPADIQNYKGNYEVTSDETTLPYPGNDNVPTDVDDVLEKVIETPPLPTGDNEVFPGGIVTYTISIYNPRYNQPISGLRLTDTLPGEPNLFSFINMLAGTAPISTYPQVVWDGLSVDAGGVTSFTFRAQVPKHIRIDPNRTHKEYDNNLSASVPDLVICDMRDEKPSQADVYCQVCLDKDVEPTHALSGEIVTYTITMENNGDTTISNIRLTDTLPSGIDGGIVFDFYYVEMVGGGPAPVAVPANAVVWDGLSVDPHDTVELSFHAVVIGRALRKYGNYLSASTPDTTIPDRENIAKVEIDPPLTIGKIVYPVETLLDQSVEYTITVCNIATGTYTLDMIADNLPDGFYAFGVNHFEKDLDPPVPIAPGECWDYPFTADVSMDVGCWNLPQTYKNEKYHVGIHLEGDPPSFWWVNSVDLAPLLVKPHVEIVKDRDHTYVLRGETFVYTITLTSNYHLPINHVEIIDTLPGSGLDYFEFVERVSGPEPVYTATPTVRWEELIVPLQGERVLAFRVHVPEDMPYSTGSLYKNVVEGSTTDLVCIEEIDPTAQVKVVDEIIELSKVVDPDEVPPGGSVRYEIRLKNLDSAPITGVVVTETLPGALGEYFEFVGMASGDPEPYEVNGPQVVWRDLTIPAETTLKLRFDAQATINFGDYYNDVTAWCPRSQIIEPDEPEDVEAMVTVLPSVILYKTVAPTQTVNGGILVYTITLVNEWEEALQSVRITDTLPSGFIYRRTLVGPNPVLKTPPVYVWDLGTVSQGATEEIVFEVQVGYDVISGTYFNKIEGDSPTALVPNVDEAAPVQVESSVQPGVFITKTVLPTQTMNGGQVVYTITLLNQRLETLEDVRITDTLPAGFSYYQMLDGPEPVQESPLVWEVAQLLAGGRQDFIFQALVGFDVVTGTYLNQVDGYTPYAIILGTGEMAPVKVAGAVQPDDVLYKTVSPPQTMSGEMVTYTISLNNRWPQTLDDVRITDTLPAGFSYHQMLSGPDPVQGSPTIVWEMTQLGEGESQDFVFQAQVGFDVITGTYLNTIEGASSSAIIPEVGQMAPVDIEIPDWFVPLYKTVSPTQTVSGGTVTYTIVVSNPDGVPFTDVRITDTLPTGFLYNGMLMGGLAPIQTSPVVWLLNPLAEQGQSLVFQARVGYNVVTGTYPNIVEGYVPLARIPGIEMAPVEVRAGSGGELSVFLPLVLRNYVQ